MILISETASWALTAVWVLLMLLILVLNMPVGYIFWSTDQLKSPRNMYIASMIVSDLLLAFLIPAKIYVIHKVLLSEGGLVAVCRSVMVLQSFLIFVNLYSVLGLALVRHRYITVVGYYHQSRREATYFIAFLWIASLVSSLEVPYIAKSEALQEEWYICSTPTVFVPNMVIYDFLVDFCLPIATIYLLCAHVQRHGSRVHAYKDPVEVAACRKRNCRVVKMVCMITNCFLVLHLPLHILDILASYLDIHCPLCFEICEILTFSTGASNIIVYALFNRRAATVFVDFMRLHRRSQVGTITTDETVTPSVLDQQFNLQDRTGMMESTIPSTPSAPSACASTSKEDRSNIEDRSITGECKLLSASHVTPTFGEMGKSAYGEPHTSPLSLG